MKSDQIQAMTISPQGFNPDPWAANAAWLVLLRWVAVAGQLLTIGVAVVLLKIPLPLQPLFGVIALTAISNVVLAWWVNRRRRERSQVTEAATTILAMVMAIDILALTALLYFAGGTANPFSVFFLVNLALSAVLLSERWSWLLTGIATLGMVLLLAAHADRPELFRAATWSTATMAHITLGQSGRIVAIAGCALVIIHFVARVTHQLAFTAAELHRVERERSRSEKLEALGTLAGGAAHELATPLSTIAVVAKEMLRSLETSDVPVALREDMALIRSEVDHCQIILQRMTGRAGKWMAEQHVPLSLSQLVQVTLSELAQHDRVGLQIGDRASEVMLSIPPESLAQALRGLLQNALDATAANEQVRWKIQWDDQQIQMVVQDEGPGMTPEVLERAGDPFFTTKDPGLGMGLGLFLSRSVIERLGGKMDIRSGPGEGVAVTVRLPRKTMAKLG